MDNIIPCSLPSFLSSMKSVAITSEISSSTSLFSYPTIVEGVFGWLKGRIVGALLASFLQHQCVPLSLVNS